MDLCLKVLQVAQEQKIKIIDPKPKYYCKMERLQFVKAHMNKVVLCQENLQA